MELLIVILIIGILAAIAIPQYMQVVDRGRATEAESILKTVTESVQRAGKFHANPQWNTLDVGIADGTLQADNVTMQTKNFQYRINNISQNNAAVLAIRRDGKYTLEKHISDGAIMPTLCVTQSDPDICNTLMYKTAAAGNAAITSGPSFVK